MEGQKLVEEEARIVENRPSRENRGEQGRAGIGWDVYDLRVIKKE